MLYFKMIVTCFVRSVQKNITIGYKNIKKHIFAFIESIWDNTIN